MKTLPKIGSIDQSICKNLKVFENTAKHRLDFRRSFGSGVGSFPEQRLVVEPIPSIKALFIWSLVPETTLPPSYPGRANFSLISLKNSTNCLHDNANSYKYFGSPTRGEMAQIVSGAHHFVQYVTCLAVSRETSVLEWTAVTTHNSI